MAFEGYGSRPLTGLATYLTKTSAPVTTLQHGLETPQRHHANEGMRERIGGSHGHAIRRTVRLNAELHAEAGRQR